MTNRLVDKTAKLMTQVGAELPNNVVPGEGFTMPQPLEPDLEAFPWLAQDKKL